FFSNIPDYVNIKFRCVRPAPPQEETVKTLTIKRTPLSELFMVVVVDSVSQSEIKFETGKIPGFDFGLKTFLTCSSRGSKIESSNS
ncbi:hypothetical protein QT982_33760, partial [Microcoleus sp. herbarium2]